MFSPPLARVLDSEGLDPFAVAFQHHAVAWGSTSVPMLAQGGQVRGCWHKFGRPTR